MSEELKARIAELVADEAGFWRSCSGCYETQDGQNVYGYPHSKIFDCTLGSGCRECGGIGAIWDTVDYDDMARSMLADGALANQSPSREAVEGERHLRTALSAAIGYMMNARIDLEMGCAKATAIATISGGIKRVQEALDVGLARC